MCGVPTLKVGTGIHIGFIWFIKGNTIQQRKTQFCQQRIIYKNCNEKQDCKLVQNVTFVFFGFIITQIQVSKKNQNETWKSQNQRKN